MFTRVLYIIVFPSHVTLIHLQCVPFILYQDMDSFVLGIKTLNTDESAKLLGVFMPSSLPS